jgi:hypothetical protein
MRDGNIVFGTMPQKIGTVGDLPKADDPSEGMYRNPGHDLLIHPDENTLSFLGKIGPLGGDEQRVEMFFHVFPQSTSGRLSDSSPGSFQKGSVESTEERYRDAE